MNKKKQEINVIVLGVFFIIGLYILLPNLLFIFFEEKLLNGWGLVALFILVLIGCLIILLTTSNSITADKIDKKGLMILIGYDSVILFVLCVLAILISMSIIWILTSIANLIEVNFINILLRMNISMIIIALTFIIQLILYIKLNSWFKSTLFKKFFINEHEKNAYLKIYQSSELTKVYSIANLVITVILLGASKDYSNAAANAKLPFFDGPLILFLVAMSVYVMNAYLFWVSPTKNSIFEREEENS
ncbi:hypothetical protein [Bacillus cereus]|uniref:hypothetical protein n=1 Tax=Bacillus cereus TaxID=1396 RepID=UPI00084CB399|nr:hypothetical protein [Bacillus cereus]MCM3201619.1 hypothetical protein [Bacillus cereus]MDN4100463.1 hypothetical protein [Bacillus cereus]OED10870.1 hypothetical protein A9756_22575 [Bacillus cereus]OJE14558.1 hypothetical protein A9488_08820 [Bacillus cereus]